MVTCTAFIKERDSQESLFSSYMPMNSFFSADGDFWFPDDLDNLRRCGDDWCRYQPSWERQVRRWHGFWECQQEVLILKTAIQVDSTTLWESPMWFAVFVKSAPIVFLQSGISYLLPTNICQPYFTNSTIITNCYYTQKYISRSWLTFWCVTTMQSHFGSVRGMDHGEKYSFAMAIICSSSTFVWPNSQPDYVTAYPFSRSNNN